MQRQNSIPWTSSVLDYLEKSNALGVRGTGRFLLKRRCWGRRLPNRDSLQNGIIQNE